MLLRTFVLILFLLVPIHVSGSSLSYTNFSDLSELSLRDAAVKLNVGSKESSGILHLISGNRQWGQAMTKVPVLLGDSFSVYFSFRIYNNVYRGDADGLGADWMMFQIQDIDNTSIEKGKGINIEYDIYNNGARDNNSGNHIGINTYEVDSGKYFSSFDNGITQHIEPRFNDGDIWYTWIDYDGCTIDVYVSLENSKPYTPDLSRIISIEMENAYIGFLAAAGSGGADFDILDWTFQANENVNTTGSVHAYPNSIWPPNNKYVEVIIEGQILNANKTELIYLTIDEEIIIIKDSSINLLDDNMFSIPVEVISGKGVEYIIDLYVLDSDGNKRNIDSTYISVPVRMK